MLHTSGRRDREEPRPGTELEFALALLRMLGLEARAEELRTAMWVAGG